MGLFNDRKAPELFVDGENRHETTTYKEFNDEQFKTAIMQVLRDIKKSLVLIGEKLEEIDYGKRNSR